MAAGVEEAAMGGSAGSPRVCGERLVASGLDARGYSTEAGRAAAALVCSGGESSLGGGFPSLWWWLPLELSSSWPIGPVGQLMKVPPREIPAPKDSGLPLNAYMLHNLAHVELNAIDLAWDTVVRFSPYKEILGEQFFADFARVADDESRHFAWCSQRLSELGFSYGDMPAHNMLWRECKKSSDDVAARLAAIPLVQEARGLDAGPRLVKKLVGFGDHRTSDIVSRIADEEVAHVAVGFYWFISVCRRMGRVPCSAFKDLLREYNLEVKGPFNYSARDDVGLPRHWYDASFSNEQRKTEPLPEVYERLAHIISMESENASTGGTLE